MAPPQRVPVGGTTNGSNGRMPITNYSNASGGFSNGNGYGPAQANRSNRGYNRY